MKEHDSQHHESFRIDIRARDWNEDVADIALIASQYSQAMSIGIWLTLFQDDHQSSILGNATYTLVSFCLCIGFKLISNLIRRSRCQH